MLMCVEVRQEVTSPRGLHLSANTGPAPRTALESGHEKRNYKVHFESFSTVKTLLKLEKEEV